MTEPSTRASRLGVGLLVLGIAFGASLGFFPEPGKNLSTDLLNATNSALPFLCSSVSAASSSNPGGNSPGNLNYGISMWYGVGSVTPYSWLGPTGNELATLSDSNVFEQRYVGTSPAAFAVGASDAIGEQQLTVTCDTGTISVYTPALSGISGNMRLYVAKDGSTYHARADHTYSTFPSGPDLTPTQALRPEHLAKASPTYQADCYNTATVTYSEWSCDGTTARKRTKFASGQGYVASSNTCSNNQLDTGFETENCASGLTCTAGTCGIPTYTVDDDFTNAVANFNVNKFTSIQAAVDAAIDDTIININAGTYTGNITVTKRVTLQGVGASQVIVDGAGSNNVLTLKGPGGTVSGITVRSSGQGGATPGNVGIHISPTSAPAGTAFAIKDSAIYGNGIGIAVWNGLNAQITIQNNMIVRNLYNAIDNSGFGQSTILNNTISDNGGFGYFDWVGKGPHIFKNNIVTNNEKYGFVSHRDSTPRTIAYNNLWNNKLGNYMEGYAGPYTALTVTPGTGEMGVDPQFTNQTYANYNLTASSPLKAKGENGVDMGSNVYIGPTTLPPLVVVSSSPTVPGSTTGLIGHWKFDGNGNNEVAGGPSVATVGGANFRTEGGKYGGYGAIVAAADWFKIPYNASFDLPVSFTIEFWFRQRNNSSTAQNLIYKGNGINNFNFKILRQLWNQYNFGPIIAGYTSAKTGYWTQTSNPNQLAHNEWHHVVYSKDGTSTDYFLDGVSLGGSSQAGASQIDNAMTPTTDIIIGDTAIDTDIDNLRIYNRSMRIDEVRSNGGFPALAPTPTSTPTPTPIPAPVYTGTYATGSGTYASGTPYGTYGSGTYANATTGTTTTSTPNSYNQTTTNQPVTAGPNTGPQQSGSGTYAQTAQTPSTFIQPPQPMLYGTGNWAASPVSPTTTPFLSPLPQEAPTALTRSLSAAEETLKSFESFVSGLDTSKIRQKNLDQAYDLIDEGNYYSQQIRRALSEGNLANANRRLGLLQQAMADIKRTWELLGRGQTAGAPVENFFSSETIIKEELASYGMENLADQIAKVIMEKINFSEIISQVVKQSSETLNKLLGYSTKHEETVSKTMDVLVTVDEKFHEEYLDSKVEVLDAVDRFDEKLALFETEKALKSGLVNRIEAVKERIMGYNFIGSTGEEMTAEFEKLIERFNDPELSETKLEEEIEKLNANAEVAIEKAREEKFEQGAIPFKDTDDNEWFTQYVVPIQKEGIISGYKDAEGNSLGQFGPANNVTVAEILKIALESAGAEQGDASANGLEVFSNHWAAGYVAKGKELGLTLLKEVETADQLNRPATRAEVVRVLLEVFNASVDLEQSTTFEDAEGHKDEAYIEKARELEIIAGYDDGTFRPDASVNRAETSKIVNLVMTSL